MLAHQHGVVSRSSQHRSILGTGDTRFSDPNHSVGHLRGHTHGTSSVDSERDEIALVHPDEISAGVDCSLQFWFIVDLHQGIEADALGKG